MIDHNAWLGAWPFRPLGDRGTVPFLLKAMDRLHIEKSWVSALDGIFHRVPHSSNRWLAAQVAGHADRLEPVPILHPGLADFSDSLRRIVGQTPRPPAIRLVPAMQESHPVRIASALHEVSGSGLSMVLTIRLVDPRARHPRLALPELSPDETLGWVQKLQPARVILAGCTINELRNLHARALPENAAFESSFLDGPDSLGEARDLLGVDRVLSGSNAPLNFQEAMVVKWCPGKIPPLVRPGQDLRDIS